MISERKFHKLNFALLCALYFWRNFEGNYPDLKGRTLIFDRGSLKKSLLKKKNKQCQHFLNE